MAGARPLPCKPSTRLLIKMLLSIQTNSDADGGCGGRTLYTKLSLCSSTQPCGDGESWSQARFPPGDADLASSRMQTHHRHEGRGKRQGIALLRHAWRAARTPWPQRSVLCPRQPLRWHVPGAGTLRSLSPQPRGPPRHTALRSDKELRRSQGRFCENISQRAVHFYSK